MHKQKSSIVHSVTTAINMGDDTHWSLVHNRANNGQRKGFIYDASFQESEDQLRDRIRMEIMTMFPGSMKLWAE